MLVQSRYTHQKKQLCMGDLQLHPTSTSIGRIPVTGAFIVNSWFLLLLMIVFVLVYTPIMIYYEEKDLLRFGDDYRDYQKRTGALFPVIR